MKKLICLLLISFTFFNCEAQKQIKTISTTELKAILNTKKIQLLDVRTPEEIKLGFIANALFINYFDKDFKEKSINRLDKSKPVYVYCRSGNRSGKACAILNKEGYEVINVVGGYKQWEKEN